MGVSRSPRKKDARAALAGSSPAAEAETEDAASKSVTGGGIGRETAPFADPSWRAGGVSDSSEAGTRNETRADAPAARCACVLPFNGTGADWDESKCPIHGPGSSVTGEATDG